MHCFAASDPISTRLVSCESAASLRSARATDHCPDIHESQCLLYRSRRRVALDGCLPARRRSSGVATSIGRCASAQRVRPFMPLSLRPIWSAPAAAGRCSQSSIDMSNSLPERSEVIADDGLRYKFKAAGSPFSPGVLGSTMSCVRCGQHRPRTMLCVRRLAGSLFLTCMPSCTAVNAAMASEGRDRAAPT